MFHLNGNDNLQIKKKKKKKKVKNTTINILCSQRMEIVANNFFSSNVLLVLKLAFGISMNFTKRYINEIVL